MLELSRRWTGWTSCQASSVRQARQHAWAMGAIVMCLVNIMSMDWWNTINLKLHVASYMRRDLEKTEDKALLQLASYMHGYQLHWALPSHWTSRVEVIAVTSTTGHACSTFKLNQSCMYEIWNFCRNLKCCRQLIIKLNNDACMSKQQLQYIAS